MASVKGSKSRCTSRYQRLTRLCWTGPSRGGNGTYRDTSTARPAGGWYGWRISVRSCQDRPRVRASARRPCGTRVPRGPFPPVPPCVPSARRARAPVPARARARAREGRSRKRRSFPAEWRGANSGAGRPRSFPPPRPITGRESPPGVPWISPGSRPARHRADPPGGGSPVFSPGRPRPAPAAGARRRAAHRRARGRTPGRRGRAAAGPASGGGPPDGAEPAPR